MSGQIIKKWNFEEKKIIAEDLSKLFTANGKNISEKALITFMEILQASPFEPGIILQAIRSLQMSQEEITIKTALILSTAKSIKIKQIEKEQQEQLNLDEQSRRNIIGHSEWQELLKTVQTKNKDSELVE